MVNELSQLIAGTDDKIVIAVFKVLVASVAMPLVLFLLKNIHTEHIKRQDRRREMYADALAACMEYREFPYVIYRRNGENPAEERTRISEALRDVQKRIAHYCAWLKTESQDVADKYDELVATMKSVAGEEMKRRWKHKPIKKDADMTVLPKMDWALIEVREKEYVRAVRKQLAPTWKRPFIR